MKVTTPQIVWHSKEPVFSADFHRNGAAWRLVTGGADKDIKVWKVVQEEGRVKVTFMASLARHSGAVNVVRFSPNGELLASAGDDNVVCLWKLGEGGGAGNTVSMETTTQNKENWTVAKMLRGHLEDIYDACWSANSGYLVTGSVDNTAIVWDVNKGQQVCVLGDSKQYVQGVSWDPIGQYVVSLSQDRHLRIYSTEHKYKCIHTVGKMTITDQEGGSGSKQFRMWIDESLSFFFRRLTFTPDGSLLIVPAGRFENGEKVTNMTYIFTRGNLTKYIPVVCLPGPEKATVIVKCCPVLFELRQSIDKEKSLFSLPYRMVYAVAGLDAVLLYDTQQTAPFAYLSNLHYSGITDLAWSNDGLILVITSSDAYCSIVTFEPGELGTPLATEKLPTSMTRQEVGNGERTSEVAKARREEEAGRVGGKEQSPAVDKPKEKAAVGMKRDAKGKRRIQATMIESFTSPEHSKRSSTSPLATDVSSSPPLHSLGGQRSTSKSETASSSPDQTTPPKDGPFQQTTPLNGGSSQQTTPLNGGSSQQTTSPNDKSSVTIQPPPEAQKPTSEKKPRRVQLETLSMFSSKSRDSDTTPSHTHSSTTTPPHPADDISATTGTDSNSDKLEPMEVQIIE